MFGDCTQHSKQYVIVDDDVEQTEGVQVSIEDQ